jgi:HNH endonuclease
MSVDFVVPGAHKGTKDARNLVTACRPCNLVKGRRQFNSLEEAKAYVLRVGGTVARLRTTSASVLFAARPTVVP